MGQAVTRDSHGVRHTLASWWRGRYGGRMLVEVAICAGLLTLYRTVRTMKQADLRVAFFHAREILRFEEWLGLPFEDDLQRFLLDHPALIRILNHYYIWFHFPTAIGLLVWLYLRHQDRYVGIRNLMAFVTFTALVIHLVFPLAPPRMMTGFVDTMRVFGPNIYPANALDGAANQIAAMPSLHFGWSMIEAMAVISVLKSSWRWLALLHPMMMTLAIIATANHWWIDAAAAGMLVIGGVASWRLLLVWVGDRHWSWTRFRFQTETGLDELEHHANRSTDGDVRRHDHDDAVVDSSSHG